jgi:YD repeat-containing protein
MLTRALGRTTQLAIAYNADARPKTAASETFTYDGFGERSVIAVTGGGTTTSSASGTSCSPRTTPPARRSAATSISTADRSPSSTASATSFTCSRASSVSR